MVGNSFIMIGVDILNEAAVKVVVYFQIKLLSIC